MNAQLYERLKKVAIAQDVIAYGDLAPMFGLDMSQAKDRAEIGRLVGAISEFEHANGRPLLSAVVISKEHNRPGDGFFTLARTLGLLGSQSEDIFWTGELARVHAYWKRYRNV
ncbi:MAG: hypothetical protein HBSAPP02_20510 [Phycisphaerae bacterium]|nr:MAG: hypothetical protein HRU71_05185 [Planctomycetia bacterium]RIK69966.1 MAG: hypothetical protein DCC66_07065 [Planctomycetota bacterium]GJQ27019.1 MAG: hypothetical protein HBSAPP02_20510 [Phycisphaerae bacterium]